MEKRPEYATNKNILKDICISKNSYCYYEDEKYKDYDVILTEMTEQPVGTIIRFYTDEHIPYDNKNGKYYKRDRLFQPFKHFLVCEDGSNREVGRSHWKGGLENGTFSARHGRMTDSLGLVFIEMTTRYGHKYRFSGYTYLDQMQGTAMEILCTNGLRFDESKSNNPFAFYTTIIHNAFLEEINKQKNIVKIIDKQRAHMKIETSYSFEGERDVWQ